jgi:hypothetical protein
VFMCARLGACMVRADVEVVSEVVYREAFAWAFVMFELGEVRDGQPQDRRTVDADSDIGQLNT